MAIPLVAAGANVAVRAAPQIGRMMMSVSQRALTAMKNVSPDVVAKANDYIGKTFAGRQTIDGLAEDKTPNAQAAVVKALFAGGMHPDVFVEEAALTKRELKMYAEMISAARRRLTSDVDENQTKRPESGDSFVDGVALNIEIERALTLLSITSDDYAFLLRSFNSHTSRDVERFQLERKMRRQVYK